MAKIKIVSAFLMSLGLMAFGAFYYFPRGNFQGSSWLMMASLYAVFFVVPVLGFVAYLHEYRRAKR